MNVDYDENDVLTAYIWFNYSHLMTKAEQFGHKAAAHDDAEWNATYRQYFGAETWSQMVQDYSNGRDAFRRRVSERVLHDHNHEIVVQRCPECQRIVRTPRAKQCLWCGHDWHNDG